MAEKRITISLTRNEAERLVRVLLKADAWTASVEAMDNHIIARLMAKLTEGRADA